MYFLTIVNQCKQNNFYYDPHGTGFAYSWSHQQCMYLSQPTIYFGKCFFFNSNVEHKSMLITSLFSLIFKVCNHYWHTLVLDWMIIPISFIINKN